MSVERIAELSPGQTISASGYDLHFDGVTERQGPNYHELAARFTVSSYASLSPSPPHSGGFLERPLARSKTPSQDFVTLARGLGFTGLCRASKVRLPKNTSHLTIS